MKERLLEFLKAENKSSAQLAEEIGVQPSGISHIISGRNNPSLDFILKMLDKYRFLSSDWLLFGQGSMYKDVRMQSLFESGVSEEKKNEPAIMEKEAGSNQADQRPMEEEISDKKSYLTGTGRASKAKRVVIFYEDGSFEDYEPRQ